MENCVLKAERKLKIKIIMFDKTYYEGKVKEIDARVQKEIGVAMQKVADIVMELYTRQNEKQKDKNEYLKLIAENDNKEKKEKEEAEKSGGKKKNL